METHLGDTRRISTFKKATALAAIIFAGMAGSASAQGIDGQVQRGTKTYYCTVWNGAMVRAHVLFIEYWYRQNGQWYNMSRGCDTSVSEASCEIDSGSERSFDSRIPIGQYPISACRAHLGAGRW